MADTEQKMSRVQLTAMVVGGMVGAGIFSLPRTFANATGPVGAAIAWLVAGVGMYTLARVFQALADRWVIVKEKFDDGRRLDLRKILVCQAGHRAFERLDHLC